MTIIMKIQMYRKTFVAQINKFIPLLHNTTEYNFHGNYPYSKVIAYTISFKPSLQLPQADRGSEYTS